MAPIKILRFGEIPYGQALALQLQLRKQVYENDIPGFVILLQHPPVITLGKRGKVDDIFQPKALGKLGAQLFKIDRGGEATYHGPGQLVIYPILHLERVKLGVVDLVRGLSKTLADTVMDMSAVSLHYDTKLPGLWTEEEPPRKMASVGMRVSARVSTHGAAINLSSNLIPFSYFAACGMAQSPMTRLDDYRDMSTNIADFESLFLRHFQTFLNLPFEESDYKLPKKEDWIQPELIF